MTKRSEWLVTEPDGTEKPVEDSCLECFRRPKWEIKKGLDYSLSCNEHVGKWLVPGVANMVSPVGMRLNDKVKAGEDFMDKTTSEMTFREWSEWAIKLLLKASGNQDDKIELLEREIAELKSPSG